MLRVPGYVVGEALGHTEPPRVFAGTADVDGRPVVLRRSTATGVVARDGLRSAVARVAGVRCADLVVPSTVVTTPEGLVIVYDAAIAAVWDGIANFAEPAAGVLAVVRAVAAMHEAGLAHGALVPDAVWLDAQGTVRLACLPGPEEADMSDDRKNLQRFAARIAVGHPALVDAIEGPGDAPAPRDLLSRLAPFATPVAPAPAPAPAPAVPPPAPAPTPTPTPISFDPPAPSPAPIAPPQPIAPSFVPPAVAPPVFLAPAPVAPAPSFTPPPAPSTPDRDVLRAPRPNRPITRPAAVTAKRRMRPLTVAVVGIALLLGAGGIGVAAAQFNHDAPAPLALLPTPTIAVTPAATSTAPTPPATPSPVASGDPAWVAVMANLDGVRDAAFVATDPTMLDRVYVEGSSAAVTEHAAMSKLRDTGVHADGLQLTVRDVRLVKTTAAHVTLRVVDELPSYRLVDAHGDTVRTEPARGTTTWRIALDRVGGGWRIATIDRVTS